MSSPPSPLGSGSGKASLYRAALSLPCTFCKPDAPLPVALRLKLGPLKKGPESALKALNQDTPLVRSQEASVGCCWFSGPIKLDDKTDQPTFWILEKTPDKWFLYLKRVSDEAQWFLEWIPTDELAGYACAAKQCSYAEPLVLAWQASYGSNEFDWPATATIEAALP
jgi:hypothetical protein